MYRISAPGQWASICQSPSATRLLEKMTRGDLLILPICAVSRPFSSPEVHCTPGAGCPEASFAVDQNGLFESG
jgi:hypothetical protein